MLESNVHRQKTRVVQRNQVAKGCLVNAYISLRTHIAHHAKHLLLNCFRRPSLPRFIELRSGINLAIYAWYGNGYAVALPTSHWCAKNVRPEGFEPSIPTVAAVGPCRADRRPHVMAEAGALRQGSPPAKPNVFETLAASAGPLTIRRP